ncbi:MAG: hypothetical protein HY042_03575 [Spirochaetia bacterium]|nr:hypothetical protein [Spirochaetia bacterium]
MRKQLFISTILLAGFMLARPPVLGGESVADKASDKRTELISYLRDVRPMIMNFPCEPYPACLPPADSKTEPERLKAYNAIKRIYQEGLVYFYERNYVNAYSRFLDAQARTEQLLESVSQSYLDRTEQMLRDSIEKKNPNDTADFAITDISVEMGPSSKLRRDFKINREAPDETRRYDPRTYHYVLAKYEIEKNMAMGYQTLGAARDARIKALMVDKNLASHQKIEPHHRKLRIECYVASINLARQAKRNAEFIFQLKYPYDNYALMNPTGKTEKKPNQAQEVPEIAGSKMNWAKNPFVLPKDLNPVFDLRLPEVYRRDAVDTRNMVYNDEVDVNIKFRYFQGKPPTEEIKGDTKQPDTKPTK